MLQEFFKYYKSVLLVSSISLQVGIRKAKIYIVPLFLFYILHFFFYAWLALKCRYWKQHTKMQGFCLHFYKICLYCDAIATPVSTRTWPMQYNLQIPALTGRQNWFDKRLYNKIWCPILPCSVDYNLHFLPLSRCMQFALF